MSRSRSRRARSGGNPAKSPPSKDRSPRSKSARPLSKMEPDQSYRPAVWHRDHRVALAGIVAATLIVVTVGFLGPSVVTLTLGPRDSLLPPWYLPVGHTPSQWLVSSLIWGAIAIAGASLFIGTRALAGGWRPHPGRLFGLGAALSVATVLVPPMTSADVLMYAAYGRLQRLGRDPYDITPAEIYRGQFDAVLKWTEQPWTDTPSVYGPITSWTQWFANVLGGDNMHDIVMWLQVLALVPFVAMCAGVVLLAHGDRDRQSRAVLFSVCNPLLIWAVLAGAHNEALSVMFAVFGLLLMRKSPFAAGIGIGLAGCVKLSIGLYGIAMLWAYRREPKKALMLCLGTAVPMVGAYVLWEPAAFFQVLRNGSYVSVGSWANPVFRFFDLFMTGTHAKIVVGIMSYSMLIIIAWMLSRVLPWAPVPGLLPDQDPQRDPITIALRTALVLSGAWLVTSMYTLSWYDLIAWVPLAVLSRTLRKGSPPQGTRLDHLFMLRGTFLSLAYVPGRAITMGPALELTSIRIRDTVSPVVQAFVLGAIVHWWWTKGKRHHRDEEKPGATAVVPQRPATVLAEDGTTQRPRSRPT